MSPRERSAGRRIDIAQTLDWLGQINQALAKVHQYGWRYLDLKPSNVLLDARSGSVKLADFGTNRLLGDRDPHSYADTANWQAPEQFFPGAGGGYRTERAATTSRSARCSISSSPTGCRCASAATAARRIATTRPAPPRCCRTPCRRHSTRPARGRSRIVRAPDRIGRGPGSYLVPAGSPGAGGAKALALLRSLLSIDPDARPPHAGHQPHDRQSAARAQARAIAARASAAGDVELA